MAKLSDELGLLPILDVETRFSRRMPISQEEFVGLSCANAQKRQDHLIGKIVDNHELWTVFDGDELPAFKSAENDILHIWPSKDFALKFCSPTILNPHAVPIPIDDWINIVVFGPEARSLDFACFPVGSDKVVNMTSRENFLDLVVNQWRTRFGHNSKFDKENPEESIAETIKLALKRSMKASTKGRLP